jgi:hypothetical protein
MVTEMDVMGFDERQRWAWLQANRVTLVLVGLTWLGMIIWDLVQGRFPRFLIVMVPVFAVARFVSFRLYLRTRG